jgi:hypothetical protein
MLYVALDVDDSLAGIALIPVPVQLLSDETELDNEVAGEVLGFRFTPLSIGVERLINARIGPVGCESSVAQ